MWVFRVRRNCSGPTARLRRLFGSEFQTVGPAEAKERQPKVLQRARGTVSWWRLADRRCRRPATSDTAYLLTYFLTDIYSALTLLVGLCDSIIRPVKSPALRTFDSFWVL